MNESILKSLNELDHEEWIAVGKLLTDEHLKTGIEFRPEFLRCLKLFTMFPYRPTASIFLKACPDAEYLFQSWFDKGTDEKLKLAKRAKLPTNNYYRCVIRNSAATHGLWQIAMGSKIWIRHSRRQELGIAMNRLRELGERKRLLETKKAFFAINLQRKLTFAFLSDLICFTGTTGASQLFWNSLGKEVDEKYFRRSCIVFNLSDEDANRSHGWQDFWNHSDITREQKAYHELWF